MTRALRERFDIVAEYMEIEGDEMLNKYLSKDNIKADYIIFMVCFKPIKSYNYNIPAVYWHDSTWHTYLHGYENRDNFSNFKLKNRELYLYDKMAAAKFDLLVYSSNYVAEACVRDYKVNSEKVKVIPFGANIFAPPPINALIKFLSERMNSDTLNLLFLGCDWERKGLGSAVQLAANLNSMGIKTILNVVGCELTHETYNFPYVIKWGFLNKADSDQLGVLLKIFQKSHFIVHPALSEPFGIALCEANAYGIPIIGTDVEGLKTIVKHGKNGYLFSRESFVEDASSLVKGIFLDMAKNYIPLFDNSLLEYNSRLNWASSTKKLEEELMKMTMERTFPALS